MIGFIKSLPTKKYLLIFFPLLCGLIIGATIILSIESTEACMITNNANGECVGETVIGEPTQAPAPTAQPEPTQEVLSEQTQSNPTPTNVLTNTTTNNNTNNPAPTSAPCK